MKQIERNIKRSFDKVRTDVEGVKNELAFAIRRLAKLEAVLNERALQRAIQTAKPASISLKTGSKKVKNVFVASKTGKKFHIKDCPFAQNIKPKSQITFKSKDTALNNGYKPCNCVK